MEEKTHDTTSEKKEHHAAQEHEHQKQHETQEKTEHKSEKLEKTSGEKSVHEHHAGHHSHHEHQKKHTARETKQHLDVWKWASIILAVILLILAAQVYLPKEQSQAEKQQQLIHQENTASTHLQTTGQPGEAFEKYKDIIADGHLRGNKNASIVVVEFSDFQCPFCGRFFKQTYPKLVKQYIDTGKVLFVYRHFPLSFHQHAMEAALASECAAEQGKFWEYHDTIFENQRSLSVENLKKFAADLGLNTEQFNACLDSQKYKEKVTRDFQDGQKYGVSGTPTFIINGIPLVGAQPLSSFETQFENLKNPIQFTVYVLNDKRCSSCDTTRIKQVTRQLFPTATIEDVDVNSDFGKQLVQSLGITLAPALVFEKTVKETAGWKNNERMQPLFEDKGDYLVLKPESLGATWIIDDQKREQAMQKIYDMLGLKKDDNMPQVDFFVMSYCPFGNQAEELLKPVYDKLKGKAKFNPRYVIYNQGQGCMKDEQGNQYCSMHGAQELHQDVRELCVYKLWGEQAWFDFALAMNKKCTSKNADSCWESVADDLGLDKQKITDCFEKEGIELLKEQYALDQALGVRGSPTLFFEGQEYNGARTSEGYMKALCAGFDQPPEECENTSDLNTVTSAPVGSCG